MKHLFNTLTAWIRGRQRRARIDFEDSQRGWM